MKTDDSNGNEVPLRALLQEWKPEASLPPGFPEEVWRRIEHAESASAPSVTLAGLCANWIANLFPRTALATAYVAVLLVIGAGLGWSQARQEAARVESQLSARYARAVDPYLGAPSP